MLSVLRDRFPLFPKETVSLRREVKSPVHGTTFSPGSPVSLQSSQPRWGRPVCGTERVSDRRWESPARELRGPRSPREDSVCRSRKKMCHFLPPPGLMLSALRRFSQHLMDGGSEPSSHLPEFVNERSQKADSIQKRTPWKGHQPLSRSPLSRSPQK